MKTVKENDKDKIWVKEIKYKIKYELLMLFSLIRLFCDPMDRAYQAPLWDFPDKNIGVGCHFFHQGMFLT